MCHIANVAYNIQYSIILLVYLKKIVCSILCTMSSVIFTLSSVFVPFIAGLFVVLV